MEPNLGARGNKFCLGAFLLCLCLGLGPSSSVFAYTDLPYTSPSTGADGALVIPDTLPVWVNSEYPLQLAYDESHGYLLAMARQTEVSKNMVTFGLIDDEWVRLASNINVSETTVTYDGARDEIIRFGGVQPNTNFYSSGPYVWTGSEWVVKTLPDNVRPSPRSRAAMAFDSVRNEVVLFGGENYNDGDLNDTWVWNGTTWTEKTPDSSPPSLNWGTMAFDAVRGKMVLFGGNYENDTWTWDGTNWTKESPSPKPPSRESSSMAYDPIRQVIVLCLSGSNGNLETWEWNGSNWTKKATTNDPGEREFHGVVYNPETSAIQLHNGEFPRNSERNADSWSWNGNTWSLIAVSPYQFDMSTKPDGIWNFTSIDVGTTEVKFLKNAANTPVIWLATENVVIDGDLNLDGSTAYQGYVGSTEPYNSPAPGGPGAFNGGLGGYYETATGDNAPGSPGSGPGGGLASLLDAIAGEKDGYHATHYQVYNSESLQAISGGSGGGGAVSTSFSASNEFGRGGNGGGGGGAILIASSRDIWVNGSISAVGGEGRFGVFKQISNTTLAGDNSQGGSGSGGSIRLVADRVLSGNVLDLDVSSDIDTSFNGHDHDDVSENRGRIRIEAYFYDEIVGSANANNHASIATPKASLLGSSAPSLIVDSIAGQNASVNPSSDPAAPEVTFSSAGAVSMVVSAQNIPDGTTVNLRVTSGCEVIIADPQALAGGTTTFSVTVPAGSGVTQVWTDWEVIP